MVPSRFWLAYSIFFSGLIVTIRTDIETLLICRYATLFLIPVAFIASAFHYLPISLCSSILGTVVGYSVLWFIATLFYRLTGKKGMGEGDLELLAYIGSFTGPWGVWASLGIGSLTGSIIGIVLLIITKERMLKLPFGAFLALGALVYILFASYFSTPLSKIIF